MAIPSSMFIVVNIIIICIYVFNLISGYRKGFFRSLLDVIGLIAALFFAWLLGPIVADYINIWPSRFTPLNGTIMADAIGNYLNDIAWTIILFILLMVILVLILKPLANLFQKIPLVKQVNGILGSAFSLILSTIWVLILSVIISTPLVSNGKEVINNTWFKPISSVTTEVVKVLEEPLMNNDTLNGIISGSEDMSESDRDMIKQWLNDNGYGDFKFDVDDILPSVSPSVSPEVTTTPSVKPSEDVEVTPTIEPTVSPSATSE